MSSRSNPDLERPERVQAVIIADSYNAKLRPLSFQLPRALMPVVNTPLLDYTIEFLASGGVDHIIVLCTSSAELIEEHVQNSRWGESKHSSVEVQCVVRPECTNTGDALRAIDELKLIENDFVLVSGDVVANLDLKSLLQKHRARCQEDKDAIMTSVYKKATSVHRTRSYQDDTLVCLDSETGQLVHYDNSAAGKGLAFNVSTKMFAEHPSVEMHYDLMDCHIDICSHRVLFSFSENFDWGDLRTDFLKGTLDSELLSHHIYTEIIDAAYAARVRCLRTYAAVSRDIIRRWSYPLVPDNNWASNTNYKLSRGGVCKDGNVAMARTTRLQMDTVVGSKVRIGWNTVITRSVIGDNVVIGNNCVIRDAYIWNDAVIGSNTSIEHSIVASRAQIGSDCKVSRSCVVGFDCVVADGMLVPENTKLTTVVSSSSQQGMDDISQLRSRDSTDVSTDSEDGDDAESKTTRHAPIEWSENVVGVGGVGRVWKYKSSVEEAQNMLGFQLQQEVTVDYDSEEETGAEDASDAFEDNVDRFESEVRDTMEDAIAHNRKMENVLVGIQGSKFAHDTTFSDCACAMMPVFLDTAAKMDGSERPLYMVTVNLKALLVQWRELFSKFLYTENDQVELMFAVEEYCDTNPSYARVLPAVLQVMYDEEVDMLTESAIWTWSKLTDDAHLHQAEPFLNWLRDAEEDEEDDEEGSEEEDDEDEEESEEEEDD